jgi:hypothetical protein
MGSCFLAVSLVLALQPVASKAGLKQNPPRAERLPFPAEAAPDQAPGRVFHAPPVFYRPSRYAVWQFYGVDRAGYFRPLVVDGPYGAYYLYNGMAYPWTSTHSRDFIPSVVAPPPPMGVPLGR